MTKHPKKPKPEEVETKPDAWERFERTMDKIAPPKRENTKNQDGQRDKDTRKLPRRSSRRPISS